MSLNLSLSNRGINIWFRFIKADTTEDFIPFLIGTYFPNICERSFVLKKYFGTKSLFGEPYRWSRNKYENNRIPPNRYRLKSGIDELLQKRVSKKGPYQTFTGPRDLSTIRNHFAPANSLGDHFYIGLNSSVDFLLNHPSKKK